MKVRLITFKTLLLLVAFSFFSCKKNSSNDYYVKLKIDGTWVTWKVVVGELGPDLADPSKTNLGITANDDAMKNVFDISIQVDGSNFNTGSYATDNGNYFMLISYTKDISTNAKFFDSEDAPAGPASKYTVNVTGITDNTLSGNFTGNYLYNSFDDESMNITEGEFFVRRIR